MLFGIYSLSELYFDSIALSEPRSRRLLDQVHDTFALSIVPIALKKLTFGGCGAIFFFHNKRHPKDMGVSEIEAL